MHTVFDTTEHFVKPLIDPSQRSAAVNGSSRKIHAPVHIMWTYPRSMDVTIAQLRYFTEAAAESSMTVAAQRLNVAQSAVSAGIARLERLLGVSLFVRQRARGLVLTTSGEAFLRQAQAVLEQLEGAVELVQGEQKSVHGRARFACYSTLAPFMLPGILAALRSDHPELNVSVLEADSEGCIGALLAGRADLALLYDMGQFPAEVALTRLGTIRPYAALPPDHELSGRQAVSLEELRSLPSVLLDLPNTTELMDTIWRTAGGRPEPAYMSASFETVRSLVANGLGYAILHQRPRHESTYDGGRVAIVEIADEMPGLGIVLARLQSTRPTRRTQAVAQATQRIFRSRHHMK